MSQPSDKRLYQIALTKIAGVGDIIGRNLLQVMGGDAEAIFKANRKTLINKGIPARIADEILKKEVLLNAEKELNFIDKNKLSFYFIADDAYPTRLKECSDAPLALYFKGNVDFNNEKVISIVGTRQSTAYGNKFCDTFLEEISSSLPGTLIISGLAYGIDINAHRAALKHGLPTIGVLAHGLDIIYPAQHRQTAVEMLANGGLLTEFPSTTQPDRFNFVRRNRIVAGMADAIIVVESDEKGGSLITADFANSYCKDVFATPGKTTDKYSKGCNKLIASHKADLFLSTSYFLQQMGWDKASAKQKKAPRQQDLFLVLTEEEQKIVDTLSKTESLHIDQLARELGIPTYTLFSTLLEMEMKGIIKNLPGNLFCLS
ncbi:DNA-processing protein DprA [Dysgonomonas sp. 511]|uniref:DNA-processing protein DprA n=1 Tax=Dysgonomonas sp. 511 TaxID=2302930 RepID=UPI0013D4791F|nr:DNA-processing protein DprA [Dysgonomonas sp. 511]NDV79018.1 DNA-protecting protein DprA [Dysgonomonas sp. 511]